MTKKTIIAKLKEAGIEFDEKLKLNELEALAHANNIVLEDEEEEEESPEKEFKVTAHLNENGTHYKPGSTILLTPARAKSLGGLVTDSE